jgi:hypothetical protein
MEDRIMSDDEPVGGFPPNLEINAYNNMTQHYAKEINFADDRFKFIPGDINELLREFELLRPRLLALATSACSPANVVMELDYVESRLPHLIDHATSLRTAVIDLLAYIDAMPDEN